MSDYLKPHTIVKIRSDLKPGLYGDHCITNNMLKYGGQLATITEVVKLDNGPDKYLYGISVDEGIYWWVKDNFEMHDNYHKYINLYINNKDCNIKYKQ